MKLRELAVVGSVEVGGAGGEQAEGGAALGEQLGLLARVGDVEGLDAVDAERVEAVDAGEHFVGVGDVPEGVRPHGDAAGLVDGVDGLGDGGRLAQAEGGRALDQVAADERADVVDVLGAQPGGVGGGAEDGFGEMGTADRLAGGDARVELVFVELEAELLAARRPCAACAARGRRGTRPAAAVSTGPVWSMW